MDEHLDEETKLQRMWFQISIEVELQENRWANLLWQIAH